MKIEKKKRGKNETHCVGCVVLFFIKKEKPATSGNLFSEGLGFAPFCCERRRRDFWRRGFVGELVLLLLPPLVVAAVGFDFLSLDFGSCFDGRFCSLMLVMGISKTS